MTGIKAFEVELASGKPAKVVRLDPEGVALLPLHLAEASAAENAIAAELGMARQRYKAAELGLTLSADRMTPVPTPAGMLDTPEDVETPHGPMRLFSHRARASLQADTYGAAPLHFFRLASHRLNAGELLINANHFLFLPPELEGFWNAYGDPIAMVAADGVVENPAQLRRACLVEDAGGYGIRHLAFTDHTIALADGTEIAPHPFGPPDDSAAPRAFSLFHGSANGATPVTPGVTDLALFGRYPLALKEGGGMPIPAAGCVLRFSSRAEAEAAALAGPITYRLDPPLSWGVQTGPLIVAGGESTRGKGDVLSEEAMAPETPLPDTAPLSPWAWKADWDDTRAARLSAGITPQGALFFCAVEGTSSFLSDDAKPEGATLDDLAELMRDQGAVRALHLDGGGSTQVFARGGGALIVPRDIHHDEAGLDAQYDRPLPLALKLL